MEKNNKNDDLRSKPFLERFVILLCDIGRAEIRFFHRNKSDVELHLDEPFYQEWLFIFYRGEIKRFRSFLGRVASVLKRIF